MSKTVQYYYHLIGIESQDERIVEGISNDTRDCLKNWIFVSTQQDEQKRKHFRQIALQQGAIVVEGLKHPMLVLSQWINDYYDNPSDKLFVIGVTGTNGKTSVTNYLKQALTLCQKKCIRLGSDENEFEEKKIKSKNTTMNMMENLHIFLEAKKQNVDVIIMEVSSHAIVEQRIGFIRFDRIIYTNITPEHLDYHKTFSNYVMSKFQLRHYLKNDGVILINAQHKILLPLIYLSKNVKLYAENLHHDEVKCSLDCSVFEYEHKPFITPCLGIHHVNNLMAVITCLTTMDITLKQIQMIIPKINGCEGRMEKIIVEGRNFIIDYAHTPSALKALCEWANGIALQSVYCVMGCGGERDREKRPLMVQVAYENCKQVIVCEDNSRNEPFNQIVRDMQLSRFDGIKVIEKREQAIQEVFRISKKGDIILVAGKGNEQFLIAKDMKTPYNDKAFIQQLTS